MPARPRRLRPPRKGRNTEAAPTLKIFKLFCASCNKLFKAKYILCLFLPGEGADRVRRSSGPPA